MTSEGLPRTWRLTLGREIRAVLHHGRRRRSGPFELSWTPNDCGHPRVGLVVPRYGASAVDRNKIRRRLREILRRRVLPNLPPVDLVVRSRKEAYELSREKLSNELESWHRFLAE